MAADNYSHTQYSKDDTDTYYPARTHLPLEHHQCLNHVHHQQQKHPHSVPQTLPLSSSDMRPSCASSLAGAPTCGNIDLVSKPAICAKNNHIVNVKDDNADSHACAGCCDSRCSGCCCGCVQKIDLIVCDGKVESSTAADNCCCATDQCNNGDYDSRVNVCNMFITAASVDDAVVTDDSDAESVSQATPRCLKGRHDGSSEYVAIADVSNTKVTQTAVEVATPLRDVSDNSQACHKRHNCCQLAASPSQRSKSGLAHEEVQLIFASQQQAIRASFGHEQVMWRSKESKLCFHWPPLTVFSIQL